MESTLVGIETGAVVIPLEQLLEIGSLRIRERQFTVLRLTASDGVTGSAYGLSRGEAVDSVIGDHLAAALTDGTVATPADADRVCRQTGAAGDHLAFHRARSLVEAAFWDMYSRRMGLPLWKVLSRGGERSRDSVEAVCVEGYPLADEDPEGFAGRLVARQQEGFTAFKLASDPDPVRTSERLLAARDALGPDARLILDGNFGWASEPPDADLEESCTLSALDWLEDPFHPEDRAEFEALQNRVGVPLAAGDDATSSELLEDLVVRGLISVLRVDPMTLGGISESERMVEIAGAAGIRASIHVSTEIARHFAFAFRNVGEVELFPPGSRFWNSGDFVRSDGLGLHGGRFYPPMDPGTGIRIDWPVARTKSIRWKTVGKAANDDDEEKTA